MPVPKKYADRGCGQLHSRMLFLFDMFKDKWHVVGMDNLYLSLRFCREAYVGKNQVLIHGVTRKKNRGLPACVIQEEEKNEKKAALVRGTTKAAVLENDPQCPNVVAFSVYDTKPVHILTTSVTSLRWIEKQRKVYDPQEGQCLMMKYLRPNVIDDYNNGMNGVDVADQLRNQYRFDHWMRKRKWWWSFWFWGIQVSLVNSYLLYKTAHLYIWKKDPKTIISQYEFRYQIVLAWYGLLSNETAEGSKKRAFVDDTTSTSTPAATLFFKKAKKVTDKALDPISGSLKARLNSDYHYIQQSDAKDPVCSVCRWAHGDPSLRVRGRIVGSCDKCLVNVCLGCFKPFHTIGNVNKLKSEVLRK
jgi:hypothetical protein